MTARFGLDVGRRAVKLVRVDPGRREDEAPRAVRGALRELPPGLDGPAAREAARRAIAECAAELGALGAVVSIGVPRSETVVKTVVLPPVPADERAALIRFQASKEVPFEIDHVLLASGVVGEAAGGGSEILYAAVRIAVVDELRTLVREAGLVPGTLEVSTQAAARAVRLLAPEAADAVLVQVGALASDIVVLRGGRLVFSRSASVGFGRDPEETGAAEAAQWLDRLGAEVQRSLRAAESSGVSQPRALLVAGGGARLEGVAATLAARLGVPCRVLEPAGEGSSAALLVARGLADARPVAGIPVLDLAGLADARVVQAKRVRVGVLSALAVGLVASLGLLVHHELGAREAAAAKLADDIRTLQPAIDELRKLQHESQVAHAWKARKGRSLEVLLAVSQALPRDDAYLTRFQWSEGHTVLLAGRARDNEAVERFLRHLNREAVVERATPDSIRRPDREKDAEAKGLDFSITAKLREPATGKAEEKSK